MRGPVQKRCICAMLFVLAILSVFALRSEAAADPGTMIILCYHSIQADADGRDAYTISQNDFTAQMEYLYTHGYRPVSLADLLAARRMGTPLPPKAVMLTFDDAYRSFADFVVPLLKYYRFPAMLAVVGRWIGANPPADLPEPLLDWDQLRNLSREPLVTIASHTYDLHKGIRFTPQGDEAASVGFRAYDGSHGGYESETAYRQRLEADFRQQEGLFLKELGRKPAALVWPYGYYNAVSLEVAQPFGFDTTFALDEKDLGKADIKKAGALNRLLVSRGPVADFIDLLSQKPADRASLRAAQVDLDLVYSNQSAEEINRRLDRLVERLVRLKINAVFLQAFADPGGNGNAGQVYFHNHYLPVRADIFAHAAHRLKIRGIKVFAWLPVLSYVFTDDDFNRNHRVRRLDGRPPNLNGYNRLSPFSPEVKERIAGIYADLAMDAPISGILFQDDAYLDEDEDFQPRSLAAFARRVGRDETAAQIQADRTLAAQWTTFKTDALIDFTDVLSRAVRRYRPDALFMRNIYSRLLLEPETETWFAQNYRRFLDSYDYTVVMAYPRMERAARPLAWLEELAAVTAHTPSGPAKTVFKLQTYDWRTDQWIPDARLLQQMRTVLAAGIRHMAYYPDDFWEGKPDIDRIKLEMSTRSKIESGIEEK